MSTLAADKHSSSQHLPNALQKVSYVCPMHTHIVREHAGTCPICGMDLVARENKVQTSHYVNVSGEMQQAMALTTEQVDNSQLWRFIKTYGSVEFNETSLTHLHSKTTGWIENSMSTLLVNLLKKGTCYMKFMRKSY